METTLIEEFVVIHPIAFNKEYPRREILAYVETCKQRGRKRILFERADYSKVSARTEDVERYVKDFYGTPVIKFIDDSTGINIKPVR